MPKPPATWKHWERKIADVFGMKRRGPNFRGDDGGLSDATNWDGTESRWWALEVKHSKRPAFQLMLNACRQAEAAALEGQEPIVVVHRERDSLEDCLVVMRLETFKEWRLGDGETEG